MVLNARALRRLSPAEAEKIRGKKSRQDIYLILEDVLDTYNIGGFFRLADAVGAKAVYLCGACATPPNHRIVKASVGTYQLVPWQYFSDSLEAIRELKTLGVSIFAVEQTKTARDYRRADYVGPVAFLFGNESYGLGDEALEAVDGCVEIPMYGFNKSLNVMVAAGIVLYEALNRFHSFPVRRSILARLLPCRRWRA
ncbi:MAG: TrmH family RNA methyltransferase [Patescibacteria group bacterium]|nr:TrmH family RNA methyltransferase [Patescibacteria group bacterium]